MLWYIGKLIHCVSYYLLIFIDYKTTLPTHTLAYQQLRRLQTNLLWLSIAFYRKSKNGKGYV